jgi:hypothetical protein
LFPPIFEHVRYCGRPLRDAENGRPGSAVRRIGSGTLRTSEAIRTPARRWFAVWFMVPTFARAVDAKAANFGTTRIEHFQPDCAGRNALSSCLIA